jgi:hypothetical protein
MTKAKQEPEIVVTGQKQVVIPMHEKKCNKPRHAHRKKTEPEGGQLFQLSVSKHVVIIFDGPAV